MNIHEIARMAGVSRSAVSRYFNQGPLSQQKRDAIKRVIEQTGYVPSHQASSLRTGRTNIVGVIIPKINSESVSRMVAGITQQLNQTPYQTLLANTNNSVQSELDYLSLFTRNNQVDGVILIGTVITEAHREAFAKLPVPLVVMDQQVDGQHCVYQDDFAAAREISQLALATSKKPTYIGVLDEDVCAGRMRREGFMAACADAHIPLGEQSLRIADFTLDSGYEQAEELLETVPDLDAIVCATDVIAYGAMTCLREYGRRVPEDVVVTGIGDAGISQVVTPTLTTIHHHYKSSGIEAATMLTRLMSNEEAVPLEVRMGYELVVRNSTRSTSALAQ